jgi:hypothetical protein
MHIGKPFNSEIHYLTSKKSCTDHDISEPECFVYTHFVFSSLVPVFAINKELRNTDIFLNPDRPRVIYTGCPFVYAGTLLTLSSY